jgi:hypothetical protein
MNLFFLHWDPKICAQQHCDKHVVKMILELTQMLYTCHTLLGSDLPENSYRVFNPKHPTNLWIRDCEANYLYTVRLTRALCDEYTYRYSKIHKCESHLEFFETHIPVFKDRSIYTPETVLSTNKKLSEQGMTPVPLAMYDDVKCSDTIVSYRSYYNVYKKRFAKWKNRETPYWFTVVDIFRAIH